MQGDAISDHVNLASRFEGLTKFYEASLVISSARRVNGCWIRRAALLPGHGTKVPYATRHQCSILASCSTSAPITTLSNL
jgi:hypothetical protein